MSIRRWLSPSQKTFARCPPERLESTAKTSQKQGEDSMLTNLKKLIKDEGGATAVEYGLIVAAIAAVIVTIVFSLGGKVKTAFSTVNSNMP